MISEDSTVLVVVDVQEKLIPVMHQSDQLITNIQKLIQCASILSVPVIHTEQRPERLGPTVAPIRDFFSKPPILKTMMSAARCQEFKNKLAGIEAMRENAVKSASFELAIFDLVKDSLHPKFKEILGVIK